MQEPINRHLDHVKDDTNVFGSSTTPLIQPIQMPYDLVSLSAWYCNISTFSHTAPWPSCH